jgi:hypothetical protein
MLFQNDPFVLIYIFTFLFHLIALVQQELPTLPEHLSSPPVFSTFVLFLLAIVFSVLLRYTDSDYHHIFKLFLYEVVALCILSIQLLQYIPIKNP